MDAMDWEQSNLKMRANALQQKTTCHPSGFEWRRSSAAFNGLLNRLKEIFFGGLVFCTGRGIYGG